jgi:RNA polymerase sigma-70 factor (ECF subfamily)
MIELLGSARQVVGRFARSSFERTGIERASQRVGMVFSRGALAMGAEWIVGSDAAVVTSGLALDLLRRGDPEQIGLAYDRHHVALRAFARRLVGDDAAAEDLVQEVFVTLPSAVRRFRDGASLESFLIAIAINHARHHVRAAARRRRAFEKLADEPAQRPTDPERCATRRELSDALARGLDVLSVDQRVAFVLLEVEERSAAEAAALAGAPEATMRTRLFHARKRLREWLEAEGYDDLGR